MKMKNNRSIAIGVAVFSVIVIIVLVFSLVNVQTPASPVPTQSNTSTPVLTSTPDVCAPENIKASVLELNKFARAFDDLSVLAENTPREQLVPIITQLQNIRREAEDFDAPPCMLKMKEYQLNYMNVFIETLVVLYSSLTSELTENDVVLINQGMSLSVQYRDQYLVETARLLGVTLPAPTPTLQTTGTPAAP
jgi:hypothetical protein